MKLIARIYLSTASHKTNDVQKKSHVFFLKKQHRFEKKCHLVQHLMDFVWFCLCTILQSGCNQHFTPFKHEKFFGKSLGSRKYYLILQPVYYFSKNRKVVAKKAILMICFVSTLAFFFLSDCKFEPFFLQFLSIFVL